MSTLNKVARTLAYTTTLGPAVCQDLAGILADAGLLAPDTPEPSRRSIEGYHTAHPWAEWDAPEATITAVKNGWITILNADVNIPLTPREAREAAHALLAAADYSEGRKQ